MIVAGLVRVAVEREEGMAVVRVVEVKVGVVRAVAAMVVVAMVAAMVVEG